jgi:hypothetical protein
MAEVTVARGDRAASCRRGLLAAAWGAVAIGVLLRLLAAARMDIWADGSSTSVFDPSLANTDLSWFVWLFPAAWLWLAWTHGRGDGAARPWLVLAWSGSFFAAALAQLRFSDLFAPGFVLVLGASLAALAHGSPASASEGRASPPGC